MKRPQMNRSAPALLQLALVALGVTMLSLSFVGTGSARAVLEAELNLKDGEDPSAPGVIAEVEARLDDQGRLRVGIDGLDPDRYPTGFACRTEVRAGGWTAKGVPIVESEEIIGTNAIEAETTSHSVVSGDKAELQIRCEFNGERHETRWEGVFGPKP